VFIIEREGGEVLLLKRSPLKDHAAGEWESGSGGILSGESPYVAVVREAKEETGLDVDVVAVIDAFHFYRGRDDRHHVSLPRAWRRSDPVERARRIEVGAGLSAGRRPVSRMAASRRDGDPGPGRCLGFTGALWAERS
jgi:8-oxo-dGTP pyrophosphatase MutT (NUDIX family)